MVLKDEEVTTKKGEEGGETLRPSYLSWSDIRPSGKKPGSRKSKKRYESPFSISGFDSLDLDVVSEILIISKLGFVDPFNGNDPRGDSNAEAMWIILEKELDKYNTIPSCLINDIRSEPNILMRCGRAFTEIIRAMPENVECVGFANSSGDFGIWYYKEYCVEMQYAMPSLLWMVDLKKIKPALFNMVCLMLQKMQGIVDVLDYNDDYEMEYAYDYIRDRLHEYKCQACKGDPLDDNEIADRENMRKALKIRRKNGIYTTTKDRIFNAKGNLKELIELFKPKDEIDHIIYDWIKSSFNIPDEGYSVMQFSNVVFDNMREMDFTPGMPYQLFRFIWNGEDDAIYDEWNQHLNTSINEAGIADFLGMYEYKDLSDDKFKADKKFAEDISQFMRDSFDICWKLYDLINKAINGRNKQRVQANTQLSCFPEQ